MSNQLTVPLTVGSIRSARVVLECLWLNERTLSQEQRAQLKHAEAILFDMLEELDEEESDSTETVIPIPPEYMSEDAMMQVIEHIHGTTEEE